MNLLLSLSLSSSQFLEQESSLNSASFLSEFNNVIFFLLGWRVALELELSLASVTDGLGPQVEDGDVGTVG